MSRLEGYLEKSGATSGRWTRRWMCFDPASGQVTSRQDGEAPKPFAAIAEYDGYRYLTSVVDADALAAWVRALNRAAGRGEVREGATERYAVLPGGASEDSFDDGASTATASSANTANSRDGASGRRHPDGVAPDGGGGGGGGGGGVDPRAALIVDQLDGVRRTMMETIETQLAVGENLEELRVSSEHAVVTAHTANRSAVGATIGENLALRELKLHHDFWAIASGVDRRPIRVCAAFAMALLVATVAVGVGARLRFANDVAAMCGGFVVLSASGVGDSSGSSASTSASSQGSAQSGLCVAHRCCYGQFLGCAACTSVLPGCGGGYPDPVGDRSDVCIDARCNAFMVNCMDTVSASMQEFAHDSLSNYSILLSVLLAAAVGGLVSCCIHVATCKWRRAERAWKPTLLRLALVLIFGVSLDAWACSEAGGVDLAADVAASLAAYAVGDIVCVLAVFVLPSVAGRRWDAWLDSGLRTRCVLATRRCTRWCRRHDGNAAERAPLPAGPAGARHAPGAGAVTRGGFTWTDRRKT